MEPIELSNCVKQVLTSFLSVFTMQQSQAASLSSVCKVQIMFDPWQKNREKVFGLLFI